MVPIQPQDLNTALVNFDGALLWIRVEGFIDQRDVDNTPMDPKVFYQARIEGVMPFGGQSEIVLTEGIERCRTEEEAWANAFMVVLNKLRERRDKTVRL